MTRFTYLSLFPEVDNITDLPLFCSNRCCMILVSAYVFVLTLMSVISVSQPQICCNKILIIVYLLLCLDENAFLIEVSQKSEL